MKLKRMSKEKGQDVGNTLFGLEAIGKFCGNISAPTVLSLKKKYTDFPVIKLKSLWISDIDLLTEWHRKMILKETTNDHTI